MKSTRQLIIMTLSFLIIFILSVNAQEHNTKKVIKKEGTVEVKKLQRVFQLNPSPEKMPKPLNSTSSKTNEDKVRDHRTKKEEVNKSTEVKVRDHRTKKEEVNKSAEAKVRDHRTKKEEVNKSTVDKVRDHRTKKEEVNKSAEVKVRDHRTKKEEVNKSAEVKVRDHRTKKAVAAAAAVTNKKTKDSIMSKSTILLPGDLFPLPDRVAPQNSKKGSLKVDTGKESVKEESMEVHSQINEMEPQKTPKTKEKTTLRKAKIPDLGEFDDLLQPDISIILTNSVSQPKLMKATNKGIAELPEHTLENSTILFPTKNKAKEKATSSIIKTHNTSIRPVNKLKLNPKNKTNDKVKALKTDAVEVAEEGTERVQEGSIVKEIKTKILGKKIELEKSKDEIIVRKMDKEKTKTNR